MFDVLADFKKNDHFFFTRDKNLKEVINAPKQGLGIYLVYKLQNGRITLVYVGAAGKIKSNGRKKAKENFFEEIINGNQFGGKRSETWKQKLIDEKIDAFDIYWYETYNQNIKALPTLIQGLVLQEHFEMQERLPEWNEEY